MTPPRARWTLASIELTDFLGFQGTVQFDFTDGLQVLEAANHTGKTTLAMGLLWGLTGEVPGLARLDRKSFRLRNRHAGDNAETRVIVSLLGASGQRLTIRRDYAGGSKKLEGTVELTVGEETLTDSEANERILDELGLKAASLEGCGVVLQDHRLKLVTGKDSDVSEVVNDMLGLEALSEVVPVLEDMAGEADGLRKEVEAYLKAGSPLQRWQEKDVELGNALRGCEDDAVNAGFEPGALEDAGALVQAELVAAAGNLGTDGPAAAADPKQEVERLRKRLGALRSSTPHMRELAELGTQQPRTVALGRALRKLVDGWTEHDETLRTEATRGELDAVALAASIAELDDRLARSRGRGEEVRGEQELLRVAYQHLLGHPEADSCPLCGSTVSAETVCRSVKDRLDVRLANEVERLEEEQKDWTARKKKAEKRLREVKALREAHHELVMESTTASDEARALGVESPSGLDENALYADEAVRRLFLQTIQDCAAAAERRAEALAVRRDEIARAVEQQEEEAFQPIEARLNRVRDRLVPLLDATRRLEAHGRLREQAEQRSGELEALLRDAKDLAGRLKKLAGAVSEAESQRATAAVQARLPFVSSFFARVAGNPDFTGLDIQTTVSRSKVGYSLRATSSRMAALGDAVGHVLSEGDLSAAGMALLLGLASGESHRLGFLLLDDPAQGMDPALQRRFAHELATLPDRPQVVILTHQPDFAAALAGEGARTQKLGRWEGGRLLGD